jgi:hypothetical protein
MGNATSVERRSGARAQSVAQLLRGVWVPLGMGEQHQAGCDRYRSATDSTGDNRPKRRQEIQTDSILSDTALLPRLVIVRSRGGEPVGQDSSSRACLIAVTEASSHASVVVPRTTSSAKSSFATRARLRAAVRRSLLVPSVLLGVATTGVPKGYR